MCHKCEELQKTFNPDYERASSDALHQEYADLSMGEIGERDKPFYDGVSILAPATGMIQLLRLGQVNLTEKPTQHALAFLGVRGLLEDKTLTTDEAVLTLLKQILSLARWHQFNSEVAAAIGKTAIGSVGN